MLGFLIGTACLIGLIATLRRGRGFAGHGGGCGARRGGDSSRHGHGWDEGYGGRRHGRRRGGRPFFLHALFERIDATPGQERAIAAAFDELRASADGLRDELQSSRRDIARAVRAESLDATVLGEVFARHDAAIEALRRTATGAVGKVHEALEPLQRQRLADLIESGPSFGRRGWGPYRSGH